MDIYERRSNLTLPSTVDGGLGLPPYNPSHSCNTLPNFKEVPKVIFLRIRIPMNSLTQPLILLNFSWTVLLEVYPLGFTKRWLFNKRYIYITFVFFSINSYISTHRNYFVKVYSILSWLLYQNDQNSFCYV